MQSGRKMKVAWKNFELIGRVFVWKSRKHCQIEFSLLFPKATFLFFFFGRSSDFPDFQHLPTIFGVQSQWLYCWKYYARHPGACIGITATGIVPDLHRIPLTEIDDKDI